MSLITMMHEKYTVNDVLARQTKSITVRRMVGDKYMTPKVNEIENKEHGSIIDLLPTYSYGSLSQ